MPSSIRSSTDTAFEHFFNGALVLRDKGRLDEAVRFLTFLTKLYRDSAPAFAMLADLKWEQGKLPEAIRYFRRATKLSPKSELASVGLFHTLWESGERKAAFEEMRRFRALEPSSKEYTRLLRDLRKEDERARKELTEEVGALPD